VLEAVVSSLTVTKAANGSEIIYRRVARAATVEAMGKPQIPNPKRGLPEE